MVSGLDGSTAIDGRVRELSSPTDRRLFVDLRSVADVVLVGAETARKERYGAVKLSDTLRDERTAAGRDPVPRLALVSRSLDLDDAGAALAAGDGGARTIIVTCEAAPADRVESLQETCDVVVAGTDRVDLASAMAQLHDLGADVVLCEGGPSVLGALFAADIVDELCLTLAPVVGGDPLPVAVVPDGADLRRGRVVHVLQAGDDLFLRYVFR